MKTVAYTVAARRTLRKLPKDVQDRLSEKLKKYAADGSGDVKAMAGERGVRMRVGDYRVIFIETETSIDVIALGHRRDIYR